MLAAWPQQPQLEGAAKIASVAAPGGSLLWPCHPYATEIASTNTPTQSNTPLPPPHPPNPVLSQSCAVGSVHPTLAGNCPSSSTDYPCQAVSNLMPQLETGMLQLLGALMLDRSRPDTGHWG